MNNDDGFHLSNSNKILIMVSFVCLLIMVITIISYLNAVSNAVSELPKLETTKGRTSTLIAKTTTTSTTTTTTTTTKKIMNSPYYTIDIDSLFSNELLTKNNLTKAEAEELTKYLFDITNKFYNINDNSLFDIKSVIENVKENEIDQIIVDDKKYGIMYNSETFINKLFSKSIIPSLIYLKENNDFVFKFENNNYYRLFGSSNNNLEIVSIELKDRTDKRIISDVTYYFSNYKEMGYTAPQYKTTEFILKFDDSWKVYDYYFPTFSK